MTSTETRNTYLDQVVAQQQEFEANIRSKRSAPPSPVAAAAPGGPARQAVMVADRFAGGDGPPPPQDSRGNAVEVRVTGFARWKTVLVPPNAFVVHTRRGRPTPLHVGLGVSFRYNPSTDSYLVVPGAMQTILINAFCICRELQGVLVQAYVQWIIQDFETAYKKLDFGDPDDPMRLVNLQLREQAEAAIKDVVSTMGVHDVLSDKQPIIEELTARLRAVAEGEGGSDRGLGLRIVTVQIKEAVVSSSRLWENLQKPYRSEQARLARLAELEAEQVIAEREMRTTRERETQRMQDERELAALRAGNDAVVFDREAAEALRRAERREDDARRLAELQGETARHAAALERERHAEELEIGRLRLERERELRRLEVDGELAESAARGQAEHERALLDLERDRVRATIDNDQSLANIQARLVDSLPEIVEKLPKPAELRAITVSGNDSTSLPGLLAELAALLSMITESFGRPSDQKSSRTRERRVNPGPAS
jgi:regulator of protease activity HflC (stomatin/prohibitin superfamily)